MANDRGQGGSTALPRVAWGVVVSAALAQVVVLTAGSGGYGYHRDELYYRMLPPAWGYVDQPPLTPLVARLMSHLGDHVWTLRLPATLAAAASVVVLGLVTRRLGGGRGAQALSAWGYAFATMPLMLGHLLLTSTVDLLLLGLVVLAVLKALDDGPRWWPAAGVVIGVTTYNRLLVAVVVAGIALGMVLLGPRQPLRSPWLWAGALVALVLSTPQLAYQAGHGWPQLAMGRALADHNAAEVRPQVLPLLLLMLGPPLVVVGAVGIGWLLRPVRRARHGFLVVAFAALVAFTWAGAAQPHYPVHLLSVMYAAGCVPVAGWLVRHQGWRAVAVALVAVNAAVSVVLALPVIPVRDVGASPVAGISPLVPDQVGWPAYVRQVATAYDAAGGQAAGVQIVTSNYGEAGAVARFGPALGLPRPFSGHNGLYAAGRPPGATQVVVMVGGQLDAVRPDFASCEVVAHLGDGVGVDNEEQGEPVAVCRGPRLSWDRLWPLFHHLD